MRIPPSTSRFYNFSRNGQNALPHSEVSGFSTERPERWQLRSHPLRKDHEEQPPQHLRLLTSQVPLPRHHPPPSRTRQTGSVPVAALHIRRLPDQVQTTTPRAEPIRLRHPSRPPHLPDRSPEPALRCSGVDLQRHPPLPGPEPTGPLVKLPRFRQDIVPGVPEQNREHPAGAGPTPGEESPPTAPGPVGGCRTAHSSRRLVCPGTCSRPVRPAPRHRRQVTGPADASSRSGSTAA